MFHEFLIFDNTEQVIYPRIDKLYIRSDSYGTAEKKGVLGGVNNEVNKKL